MTKLATIAAILLTAACSTEADIGSSKHEVTLCNANSCNGPAPLSPNYVCADGTIAGPACVQDANSTNTCSWQIIPCDPTTGGGGSGSGSGSNGSVCSTTDCGPAPGVPSQLCSDGTIAGPTCGLIPNNTNTGTPTCGWTITTCPDPTTDPCGPNSCTGPAPASPNYLCSDGTTIAGPACRPLSNTANTCGWTIVQCP